MIAFIDSLPILLQMLLAIACVTLGLGLVSRLFGKYSEVDYRKQLAENDGFLAQEYELDLEHNDLQVYDGGEQHFSSTPLLDVDRSSTIIKRDNPQPLVVARPQNNITQPQTDNIKPRQETVDNGELPVNSGSLSLVKNMRVADMLSLSKLDIRTVSDLAKAQEEFIIEQIETNDDHSRTNAKHWIKQAQLLEDGRIEALLEYQQSL